jgi:L-threonylcarbamoyladenylate synthase
VRLDFQGWSGEDEDLLPVVEHLRGGGLIAYPTETVYGFGCALTPNALARLAALKGRGPEKPALLLVPSAGAVPSLVWTHEAGELARAFWPGSLTLVLSDPEGSFPVGVRSAAGGVAVRQSSHPLARRLVELLGAPLTSTSANPPGGTPARSGDEAWDAAALLGAGEELWTLDVGRLPESAPSTIVDCTGVAPRVARAGQTPVRRIRCVLPRIDTHQPEPHGSER